MEVLGYVIQDSNGKWYTKNRDESFFFTDKTPCILTKKEVSKAYRDSVENAGSELGFDLFQVRSGNLTEISIKKAKYLLYKKDTDVTARFYHIADGKIFGSFKALVSLSLKGTKYWNVELSCLVDSFNVYNTSINTILLPIEASGWKWLEKRRELARKLSGYTF